MIVVAAVADTHTALWHLFSDRRLSDTASRFIQQSAEKRQKIAVSSITLAEIVYLVEKGRLPAEAYDLLCRALADPENVLTEAALTSSVVESMRRVSRNQVPDLADRIIAGTALFFGVPAISRDRRILSADLETIW